MQWHVAGLLKSSVGETRDYVESEQLDRIDGEVPTTAPLTGAVRLTRTNRGIFVDAKLGTRVRLICGRCLENYEEEVKVVFSEEFFCTVDVNTGLPVPVEDPDAFTIGPDHVLDLEEAVRQYALLEMPMHPRCRPDCAGLCPHCGHDLNQGRCSCGEGDVDGRLAVLSRWFDMAQVEAGANRHN